MAAAHLYRHFSADGVPLYVGVALSAVAWLKGHQRRSRWFNTITSVTVEAFPSREAALAAEMKAIQTENPLHNVIGRSDARKNPLRNTGRRSNDLTYGIRVPRDLVRWLDLKSAEENRTRANPIVHLLREAESAAAKTTKR